MTTLRLPTGTARTVVFRRWPVQGVEPNVGVTNDTFQPSHIRDAMWVLRQIRVPSLHFDRHQIESVPVRSGERNSELYLKLLIEQLHGVSLTQRDRDGRQGAVDFVFTSPSASGAVEMTTIQDGRAAAWGSKLGDGETIECISPDIRVGR